MEEKLVDFDTAILAKKKGFDWNCQNAFDEKGNNDNSVDLNGDLYFSVKDIINAENNMYTSYLRPTQSLLQKWIREVHNIHIELNWMINNTWIYWTVYENVEDEQHDGKRLNTYELALEEGLKEALNLLPDVEL